MSLVFATIEGRPAFFCPGCVGYHRVPERLEIVGTDAAPSVVDRDGQALFVMYGHGCRVRVKDGTLAYDPSCAHVLRGAVRAMTPAPQLAPEAARVRYSALVAA